MEISLVGKIWDDGETVTSPDRLGFSQHMKIRLEQSRIERTQVSVRPILFFPILLCKTNLDTSSLPELAKVKLSKASQLYFKKCIVQSNRKYQVEVLLEIESQLNGHTIGFHPQTQKLELHTK